MSSLRHVLRGLGRDWAFTLAATSTLALGLGAAVLIFSVLYGIVLKPWEARDAARLVFLWINDTKRGIREEGLGYPTYLDWKAQSTVFEDIAVRGRSMSATLGGTEPERLQIDVVSANYFALLGGVPVAGRVFTHEEELRGDRTVILSERLARRRFGSAEAAVGQAVELDAALWRVAGVMPPGFGIPPFLQDAWVPARTYPPLAKFMDARAFDFFMGIARLKPGKSAAQAATEMNVIGRRLAIAHPITDPDFGGYGVAVVPFHQQILGQKLPSALWLLMGAVALVLLVACANVANLLLARGEGRQRDLAIRVALGASRASLFRMQLWESVALASAAAILGTALAWAALQVLPVLAPENLPRAADVRMHPPVLLFAIASALAAALVFGLAPAWLQSRRDPQEALRGGGSGITHRTGRRLQSLLIIGEFAVSLMLLTGASLFLRSLLHVDSVDPGFDATHTLLLRVDRNAGNRPEREAFYRGLLDDLRAQPGVAAAGAISSFFYDRNADYVVSVQGRATESREQVTVDAVSWGFLEAAGVRLLRGRRLEERDYREEPSAVVINETFARRFFPGQNAIQNAVGQKLKFGTANAEGPWIEVVGVVADLRRRGLEREPVCEGFGPIVHSSMDVLIRTSSDPASALGTVRGSMRRMAPGVPWPRVTTLEATLREMTAQRRLQTWALGGFSLLTLLLAAVGIYATLSYLVRVGRRELAIRTAVGARPWDVQRMVLARGLWQVAAGVAIGVALSLGMGRVTEALLYGVRAQDPLSFAMSCGVLVAVALLACWIPARAASRVDPASLTRSA